MSRAGVQIRTSVRPVSCTERPVLQDTMGPCITWGCSTNTVWEVGTDLCATQSTEQLQGRWGIRQSIFLIPPQYIIAISSKFCLEILNNITAVMVKRQEVMSEKIITLAHHFVSHKRIYKCILFIKGMHNIWKVVFHEIISELWKVRLRYFQQIIYVQIRWETFIKYVFY